MSGTEAAEVREELRDLARRLLEPRSPLQAGGGSGQELEWSLLSEVGFSGLEIPEKLGGAGVTFEEMAVVLSELGRAAGRAPLLGSAVLASGALLAVEPVAGRDGLSAQVAGGGTRVAVALSGETAVEDASPQFEVRPDGRLHGRARFVPDAAGADRILVPAAHTDGRLVVADVEASGGGLSVEPRPVLDGTRDLADVTADGVAVGTESIWTLGDGPSAFAALVDRAALAVACDSAGIAAAMLEATVAYAKVRQQFDRPIGSFQAVKHACADMLVACRLGQELVDAAVTAVSAVWAVADLSAGSRDLEHARVAVSMAKAEAGAIGVELAGRAMQLHGGIGYTWESGIPAYLKRATLNRALFGSPAAHRRRLAARYRG